MRKISSFSFQADKKKEEEFQVSLINNSSSSMMDDMSTNFLDDELDDESMGDFDLY
jgi:hypothetical protein